ncbi:glycosyltransferase family 2 protein [Cytobacillus oceanisediminis]|uniref:glycosyltransferase family 2 protein n=1 Tax=Cytobacillus oceanisediminis TaxID=665099 RepID=UPI001C241140|nr:glycosyltransferase [Cytobacillus oceanisediminis]MBU8772135.1 glycosyltransferase [Cytobacillus oceanisediminis]
MFNPSDITVVIPVYNQAFSLALTLYGFTQQLKPYNKCPIVVVDDGSTEPIEAIVESYKDNLNITYKKIKRSGRAVSRNIGAQGIATGLIIFCDADRIPREDFIMQHYNTYSRFGSVITIGQVREMYIPDLKNNKEKVIDNYLNKKGDRIPQYCKMVYNLYDENGYSISKIPWISVLSGNMSISADIFKKLGGFDPNFIDWGFEHFEFGYRAYLNDSPFFYQYRAVNVHLAHPRSSSSYIKNIKESHAYFYQKHHTLIVNKFKGFMLGNISIRDFAMVANPRLEVHKNLPNQLVKITNV